MEPEHSFVPIRDKVRDINWGRGWGVGLESERAFVPPVAPEEKDLRRRCPLEVCPLLDIPVLVCTARPSGGCFTPIIASRLVLYLNSSPTLSHAHLGKNNKPLRGLLRSESVSLGPGLLMISGCLFPISPVSCWSLLQPGCPAVSGAPSESGKTGAC